MFGGLHRKFKVKPDIAVFAKSIANGYPIGVVIGTDLVMEAAQKTFISSTNWTDAIGPAAAIACIKKYVDNDVSAHLEKIGKLVQEGWERLAQKYGLSITLGGLPSLCSFQFEHTEVRRINTFLTVEMLQFGILGFRQFKPSFAHNKSHVEHYLLALEQVFQVLNETDCLPNLTTPLHHTGFSRLTKE